MDSGKTVGTRGSEEGLIVSDEEHGGCTAPWSVTCGIYGSFLHTAFASSEAEGRAKYSDMKADLEKIIGEQDNEVRYERMKRFADMY